MNNLNWEQEHKRFMTIAYDRTQKAAKRAFYGWHESKRPDAIAECLGKMWDQWSRLLLRGTQPRADDLCFDQVRNPLGPIRPQDRWAVTEP